MKKTTKQASKEGVRKKRLVLLDAHAIIHRAYHALPDFVSSKGEPTGALYGLISMVLKIANELNPDYLVACFDLPDPTHRHVAYDGYKGTRKKTDDALVAQLISSRNVFKAFGVPMYELPGFEADDLLGTIVEKLATRKDVDIIIASGDMDTLQLVNGTKVRVYTLKKGIKDTIIYDEAGVEGRYGFKPVLLPDFKGLAGDPSDNIIGVPGIGEKSATHLIQTFGTVEKIYTALKKDEEALITAHVKPRTVKLLKEHEDEAKFSTMLATIRRDAPISFVLPERSWRDALDPSAVRGILIDLDFRSMRPRIEELLRSSSAISNGANVSEVKANTHTVGKDTPETGDPGEIKEAGLALWLIDSTIAHPTAEDILSYVQSNDPGIRSIDEAKKFLVAELNERGLARVYEEIELPLIPVVERMELRGVSLDIVYLKKLATTYRVELNDIGGRIFSVAGREFNINSPKQLGEVLFDELLLGSGRLKKTPTGARTTRESELMKLRGTHPIIDMIFEYRERQKLLSTYIEPLPTQIGGDGRLHTTFLQTGTTTGRMSSNNPNLQNIPVKTERGAAIRRAFTAAPGYVLLSCDYSQIELRVAAFLSGDEKLIEIFQSGRDVHAAVASRVFGVSEEGVTKEMRRRAKVINFGILYGMGVNALRENLGTNRAEAATFYANYFTTFSTLAEYLESVRRETRDRGYTTTLFGRRRYLPGIKSPLPHIRAMAERMAVNAPIQGTQADIIKLAMVKIDEAFRSEGFAEKAFPILQVHDELIFEIHEEALKEAASRIVHIMETVVTMEETRGVSLVVNAASGPNWGELKGLAVRQ